MNKVEFNSNTYTENSGGNGRGIVTVWGAPRVFFNLETYANNSEMANETLIYIATYDTETTIL